MLLTYIHFLSVYISYGRCNLAQPLVFRLPRCWRLSIYCLFLSSLHKMMLNYQTLLRLFHSISLFYHVNLWLCTLLHLCFIKKSIILLLSFVFYKFSRFYTANLLLCLISITILFYLIICLIFVYYFWYLKQLQHIN